MRKLKPVHDLGKLKELIEKRRCRTTITAQQFAHELGFSVTDIQDVVLELNRGNFVQAISENNNPKAWQDVYRYDFVGSDRDLAVKLYIKVKISKGDGGEVAVILSFKRWGDERMKP